MIDTINLRRPFTFARAERNLKLALEDHDWPEEDKQPMLNLDSAMWVQKHNEGRVWPLLTTKNSP